MSIPDTFSHSVNLWRKLEARVHWRTLAICLFAFLLLLDFAHSRANNKPQFSTGFSLIINTWANTLGHIKMRPGYLSANEKMHSELHAELQPFDIVIVSAPFKGTSFFTPGDKTHMAVWLGNADDWQRNGWDQDQHLQDIYHSVKNGHSLLQSDRKGVALSPLQNITNADTLSIYRMQMVSNPDFHFDRIRENLGKSYDYNLDGIDHARMICTELVSIIFPDIPVHMTRSYGRDFIVPDGLEKGLKQSDNWRNWRTWSQQNTANDQ